MIRVEILWCCGLRVFSQNTVYMRKTIQKIISVSVEVEGEKSIRRKTIDFLRGKGGEKRKSKAKQQYNRITEVIYIYLCELKKKIARKPFPKKKKKENDKKKE